MIKAVLIDDEPHALEMLEWQLKQYCPQVQIASLCHSADEGIEAIKKHSPDLVFLDIEMPGKNGFEVIRHFPDPSFDIIFATAYNQFALQAFKAAALDYLLKPVDAEDLKKAIDRFEKKQLHKNLRSQLEQLLKEYKPAKAPVNKIALPTSDGIVFADPAEITRAEASSNYAIIHFTNKTKLVMAKTLKEVEELLHQHHFIRIHQSHLVNIEQIARYTKADGGMIYMKDDTCLPVSRQRKDEVARLFAG